jgi:hypothetical protein
MIHTGDITHLSKPSQFDTAQQLSATRLAMLGRCWPGSGGSSPAWQVRR